MYANKLSDVKKKNASGLDKSNQKTAIVVKFYFSVAYGKSIYYISTTHGVICQFFALYFIVRPAKFEKSFFSARPITFRGKITILLTSFCRSVP